MSETSSLTVLVIDDEETHADIVSRVIAKAGHRVDMARSVEEALGEIENRDYDLVITDIFMSGMQQGLGEVIRLNVTGTVAA